MVEESLVFIKPDAVQKGQVGAILGRFEKVGLTIMKASLVSMTEALTDKHYEEHTQKPFYPNLKDYIMSSPIMVFVLSGDNAIQQIRDMVGTTNPQEAASGTIRADFGTDMTHNAVHASDSRESAAREIANFFG